LAETNPIVFTTTGDCVLFKKKAKKSFSRANIAKKTLKKIVIADTAEFIFRNPSPNYSSERGPGGE
jgi:hypothetical protein